MPRIKISDKIQGNKIDLSLSNLEEVPVADLVPYPKGTNLDLSCNSLTRIPNDFAKLTHLIVLDLSKNHISDLPSNFGDLINLHTLDLFNNNLTKLPISMCRLHRLRWLDLKQNPIHDTLRNVAGECLSEAQCMTCARNVVSFMKQADLTQEKTRAEKEQQAKEREQKLRQIEESTKERERQIRLKEKELEKDRKRLMYEERQRELLVNGDDVEDKSFLARDHNLSLSATVLSKKPVLREAAPESRGSCAKLVRLVVGVALVAVAFAIVMNVWCSGNPYSDYCDVYDDVSEQVASVAGQSRAIATGTIHRGYTFVSQLIQGDGSHW